MLDHLRHKAVQTLASASSVTLSTCGPADIQSSHLPCTSQDLTLYVFIPSSSDHLLNLEYKPGIVAATDEWDLQGNACLLAADEIPAGIKPPGSGEVADKLASSLNSEWGWSVVEIKPTRLTLHAPTGLGNLETIDF